MAPGITNTKARLKPESLFDHEMKNNQYLAESDKDIPLSQHTKEDREGQRMYDPTDLERVNDPKDVVNAIMWLASSDASFVTGEVLTVDGGQSLTTNRFAQYEKDMLAGGNKGWNLFGGT